MFFLFPMFGTGMQNETEIRKNHSNNIIVYSAFLKTPRSHIILQNLISQLLSLFLMSSFSNIVQNFNYLWSGRVLGLYKGQWSRASRSKIQNLTLTFLINSRGTPKPNFNLLTIQEVEELVVREMIISAGWCKLFSGSWHLCSPITSEPNQVAWLVEMSKMNQLGPVDGFKWVNCIRRIEIAKRNTSSLLSYSWLLAGSVLLI